MFLSAGLFGEITRVRLEMSRLLSGLWKFERLAGRHVCCGKCGAGSGGERGEGSAV